MLSSSIKQEDVMEVYILRGHTSYEGSDVLGVYSTYELAKLGAEKLAMSFDNWSIDRVNVQAEKDEVHTEKYVEGSY
jgi:hypothetical protein